MHRLDLLEAFLYWIPSIAIIIIMVTVLSYSFWRYHKKKEKRRKSQREYLEMKLSAKRPRIGALRCYTHSIQPLDMLQSFSASSDNGKGFKHLLRLQSRFTRLDSVHEEFNESWPSKINYCQGESDSDTPRSIMQDLSLYEDTFHSNPKSSSTKRSKHSIDYDDYDLSSEIKKSKERKRKRKKKRRNQIWTRKLQNENIHVLSETGAPEVQNRMYKMSGFNQSRLEISNEGSEMPEKTTTWSEHGNLIGGISQDYQVLKEKDNSTIELPLQNYFKPKGTPARSKQSLNSKVTDEKIFWVKTDDVAQSSI